MYKKYLHFRHILELRPKWIAACCHRHKDHLDRIQFSPPRMRFRQHSEIGSTASGWFPFRSLETDTQGESHIATRPRSSHTTGHTTTHTKTRTHTNTTHTQKYLIKHRCIQSHLYIALSSAVHISTFNTHRQPSIIIVIIIVTPPQSDHYQSSVSESTGMHRLSTHLSYAHKERTSIGRRPHPPQNMHDAKNMHCVLSIFHV